MSEHQGTELREIYLAGGCFWGVEEYFSRIPGVAGAVSGYANGRVERPTYEQVCLDTTGFAEAVRISYDPDVVTLRILIRQFFEIIDPISVNRQGNDRGSQYRTGDILYRREGPAIDRDNDEPGPPKVPGAAGRRAGAAEKFL